MGGLTSAFVVLGVGLVLLALLVLVARRHVRRFGRARAELSAGMTQRVIPLRSLVNFRRPGNE